MQREEIDDRARTRAHPLPEERAAQVDGEDTRAEAEAILRESEDRVSAAAEADRPGDAAVEHRRSEDTADTAPAGPEDT